MFSRYGLLVVAFGLIFLLGSGQAQEQTERGNGDASEADEQNNPAPFAVPVIIVESPSEAGAREAREAETRQREIDDLAAQVGMNAGTDAIRIATEDMRDYSLVQTWAIVIGTIALIWTLWETRKTSASAVVAAKAARESVDVAREMGMKQVRAYIFCESVSLEWDAGEDSIRRVVLPWNNTGNSPASKVSTHAALLVCRPASITDMITEKELDASIEREAIVSAANYMPPRGSVKSLLRPIQKEEVAEFRRGECAILIAGMVRYVDEFKEPHVSRCCFRLVYEETPTHHVTHFERFRIGNDYE